MLGERATPEKVAALRVALGLDRPIWIQYVEFVGRTMDLFKAEGGASVKLLINYHRTLFFEENVPDTEAADLFARNPPDPKASLAPAE